MLHMKDIQIMKIRTLIVSLLVLGCLSMANNHPDKEMPQRIQAFIGTMKEEMEKNDEQFPELINEIEQLTADSKDPASTALLHSMTAEMVHHYYTINRWKIEQRTDLAGYIPKDMREWSANLFTQKINEELSASLRPAALLQQTPVSNYHLLLVKGNDTPAMRPTLFDFLAFRALEIAPTNELYETILAYQRQQSDKKAAVLTELNYLNYRYSSRFHSTKEQEVYSKALDSLLTIYKDKAYSVEIVDTKIGNDLHTATINNGDKALLKEAYDLCQQTIARFPNYERIGLLTNRLADLQQPVLQINAPNTVYPGKDLQLRVEYKNIQQVTARFYRSKRTPQQTVYMDDKINTKGALVKEITFSLLAPNSYTQQDTILSIPLGAAEGLYECVLTATGKEMTAEHLFEIGRYATSSRNLSNGKSVVYVTDFQSGKPAENITVTYYSGKRNNLQQAGSVTTDKNGVATIPNKGNLLAYRAGKQQYLSSVYGGGKTTTQRNSRPQMALFTDRGLYRPGQTLYYKGIVYLHKGEKAEAVANKSMKIVLRDTNWKEVATQTLTTNSYGSFHGEFTLPQGTLNGHFTLSTEYGNTTVRVEAYKRPTFQVELFPVKEEITFGNLVTIQGKAETFSGVSLSGGKVTYRITEQPMWLRGYYPYAHSYEQVTEGETIVQTDGSFSFAFRPEESDTETIPYRSYRISVLLTNTNGETQEGISTVTVGKSSIVLSTNLKEQVKKESATVIITGQTLNQATVTVDGKYALYRSEDKEPIASGSFTTGEPLNADLFRQLPSDRYRLQLTANDSKGRPATAEQEFILYSPTDKRPPVFTHTWLLEEKIECLPGEEAVVTFGTSDKQAYVLRELFVNGNCMEREQVVLSNKNQTFRIPFKASYGDGVIATFTFIKEGKVYTAQTTIRKKQPNKQLSIRPITFRDRLQPGEQETWKFRIQNADSVSMIAELMAGMYDASLDKLLPNDAFQWRFNPQRTIYLSVPHLSEGINLSSNTIYNVGEIKWKRVKEYEFDRLDWQGALNSQKQSYNNIRMMKSAAAPMAADMLAIRADGAVTESMADAVEEETAIEKAEVASSTTTIQLRENFNETAFFYPTLLTDENGKVFVEFTLPESNTTWKFQAIAHTPDMHFGSLTEEIISSKPLMILPNLPHFMRQGDEVTVTAQIINQSDELLEGRASIELFDPETNQPVICLTKSQRPFELEADSIQTVAWKFRVPETVSLMGCRIVADTEYASDGEQHLIPILSNRILLTESTPFYLMDNKEKTITLSGNHAPFKTTLELTANPIWYAIQALPTLTNPAHEDVISWFAVYYSNTLATHIANSQPRIQQVIKQWKTQGGTVETLQSNLQRNQELKNILLEETPWVLEAENEAEQKQRLSLLFDLNRTRQQRETALQKLQQLQDETGGWSWFKGFPVSHDMTISILKGMAQLVEMGAVEYGEQEKLMQQKALNYLDKAIAEAYQRLQKQQTATDKVQLSPWQIDFLLVRSNYRDIPEGGDAREAIRFYTDQAAKSWQQQSLYGKGATALLMHRNGNRQTADSILAWLRKTATTSAEQGMYWANNRRENNYLNSPIETHCLLMNLFRTLSPDTKETDRMKQWLLNQKRTQLWESTPATLQAIYALVITGSNWLSNDNNVQVTWGNQTFHTADGETATGYLRLDAEEAGISSERNSISIRKEGNAPAWGAVYEQYFERLDKVKKQQGSLNVEKKLFIESNSGTGLQLTPVADGKLQIGDKVIVRLTIRNDRDMEYIFLKDLRAGSFEPAAQLSGTKYRDGVFYYQSPTDVAEHFFFYRLPAGTFVIEYPVYVTRAGEYAGGISTIQSLYAPEFSSHTEGGTIKVNN